MVKPNSNELDHCPSAALYPRSKRLDGAMMLPAAGEISGNHRDKPKRVGDVEGVEALQAFRVHRLGMEEEVRRGVITPNPKGSYPSSKGSRGRPWRPHACGLLFHHSISSTAAR